MKRKWIIGIVLAVLLIGVVRLTQRLTGPPLPFWRYQSLTAPNATSAQMEEIMRAALVGSDHAEFTYLSPNQLGITSFGSSPALAMDLSGRLEEAASHALHLRGMGPVMSTANDSGAYSDGDPDDFRYWRVHYFLRNLGFPAWHFDK